MSFLFTELVATVLSSKGVGVFTGGNTTGNNIFCDTMPTSPLTCTAVIATGGPYDVTDPVRHPTFQILHRNTNITSARWAISMVHTIFNNQWNVLCPVASNVNTAGYTGRTYSLTEPGVHWRDSDNLIIFSTNYMLMTVQQS